MMIIRSGNKYADIELSLLQRHLCLLDLELSPINAEIAKSPDPESEGLFDSAEYFIAHGFVAIQRYLTATRTALGLSMSEAFATPPMIDGGMSLAAAINTGANFWKHMEEWIETINKSDDAELTGGALRTLQQIETVTPWEEYTCSNLLAALLDKQALELSRLLPKIEEWRNNLLGRRA